MALRSPQRQLRLLCLDAPLCLVEVFFRQLEADEIDNGLASVVLFCALPFFIKIGQSSYNVVHLLGE